MFESTNIPVPLHLNFQSRQTQVLAYPEDYSIICLIDGLNFTNYSKVV